VLVDANAADVELDARNVRRREPLDQRQGLIRAHPAVPDARRPAECYRGKSRCVRYWLTT
jgi:hypothetical protein